MLYPAHTLGNVITGKRATGESIIDWSKGKLRLYALDINQRAQELYRKHGFETIAMEWTMKNSIWTSCTNRIITRMTNIFRQLQGSNKVTRLKAIDLCGLFSTGSRCNLILREAV